MENSDHQKTVVDPGAEDMPITLDEFELAVSFGKYQEQINEALEVEQIDFAPEDFYKKP